MHVIPVIFLGPVIICTLDPSKSGYCLDEPVQIGVFAGGPEECSKHDSGPYNRYLTVVSVYNNIDWLRQIVNEGKS